MVAFDINSDAVVVLAAKLEKVRKVTLPVVVRQTLNSAALHVKKTSMPVESDRAFKKRKPTFFSATSKVDFAKGLDIASMHSTVGFIAPVGSKESGHATRDLEQQEYGGEIDKRAFIATDAGRTGRGNVKDSLTMARIKSHILDANDMYGKNEQERFIKAAVNVGVGGFVIGTGREKSSRLLMRIKALHVSKRGQKRGRFAEEKNSQWKGGMIVQTENIYSVEGKRKAKVDATHFMEKASETTSKQMASMFAMHANKMLNK